MQDHLSRRLLLATVGAGSLCLAGCLDGDDPSASLDDDETTESTDDDAQGSTDDDSGSDDDSGADDDSGTADDQESDDDTNDEPEDRPAWMTVELVDVTSEETFTLGEFDVPVLLETFAVWCPDCLDQQRESAAFHDETTQEVVSVGLNVDPNEDDDLVRTHVEEHGFDWYFAVSPGELTGSLAEEFGDSIAHPPASPVVLICPDGGFRRLEDGLLTADDLEAEVEAGC